MALVGTLLLVAAAVALFLGAAAGNPCFVGSPHCIKKDNTHLKTREIVEIGLTATSVVQNNTEILGIEGHTVPVFVLVNSKRITLRCLTQKMAVRGIISQRYSWNGPQGIINKDSEKLILTEEGCLVFYNIHGYDSGRYTCNILYASEDKHVAKDIHFMIYVYHMPGKSLHLSCEFKTDTCKTISSFEQWLLETLQNLVHDLQCQIPEWNMKCRTTRGTMDELRHVLTFQFVVFPYTLTYTDTCENLDCDNSNIKKAYVRIKHLFEKMGSSHSSHIHYIKGSLTGVKVDHCKPGYGKNDTTCSECCTCPPGKFSARFDTTCISCAFGSYNANYGQTACINCPKSKTTGGKGSKNKKDCQKTLQMWIFILISSLGTCLLLGTSWIIAHRCCRRSLAAQYIEEAETGMKKILKTFSNIANVKDIQEQRSKLRNPSNHFVKINLPKYKVHFPDDQAIGLLSNEDFIETSTNLSSSPFSEPEPSEPEMNFD